VLRSIFSKSITSKKLKAAGFYEWLRKQLAQCAQRARNLTSECVTGHTELEAKIL
jgi:hypothetical protein